ncbi:MAG TPA: NAD-dependent epimerase/dehydratase family protein [Gammaproteobacteria bacterium]|nr:NAD-dependent epimerase/dehydratase family protein [Gammaproteobacteria bacterium]
MKIKQALVTGASGFIGRALCAYLVQQGIKVTAVSRTAGPYAHNIVKEPIPDAWWKGVDVVFHLAGVAHAGKESSISDETYQKVNVETTQSLLNQAIELQVSRFVFFSSVKAIDPVDRYGYSKLLAEERVLLAGQTGKIGVSILRPALVYGPSLKGNLGAMERAIKRGWLPTLPETGNRRSLISVQDLIRAALVVAESPHTVNRSYAGTDGIGYSTRNIYDVLCTMSGRKPSRFALPKWVFWLATQLIFKPELFEKLFGSAFFPDLSLAQDTGWEPEYSLWDIDRWNIAL